MPGLERQRPGRLLLRIRVGHGAAHQPLVQTKQGVVASPQRHHGGPRQGGSVYDEGRAGFTGELQAVGQHQAPLCVCVDYFDRGAVLVGEDVTQLVGMAGDQVLGAAEDELHPLVEAAQYGQRQGAGDNGRPPHVMLHGEHAL
ncbi:hypothetical protein D3C75_1019410 [compost metagenome]